MDMHERDNEDEVSLLDLLVVVAENIKLLILGPLLVGALVLGVGWFLPSQFTSVAIVTLPVGVPMAAGVQSSAFNLPLLQMPTPAQAATLMLSPVVLDSAADSLKLSGSSSALVFLNQVKATVGKDQLLRLEATADTPVAAQMLVKAVLAAWLQSTLPGPQERSALDTRLAYAQKTLDAVTQMLTQAASGGGANMMVASELQARYLTEVVTINRALQGLTPEVITQTPTLPTEPAPSKKKLAALLALIGTGFVLLVFVFMRQAWNGARFDPESAQKQARVRAALGLKG